MKTAAIHDYKSGVEIGREEINWSDYLAWAEGPSEVCEARRCLTTEQIERFSIQPDTTIFVVEV